MAAPAEKPATATLSRGTECSRIRSSAIPARIAGSPKPRDWCSVRNQFQQPLGLSPVLCSGQTTIHPCRAAMAFIAVPRAKSSDDWVHPCSIMIRPFGRTAGTKTL